MRSISRRRRTAGRIENLDDVLGIVQGIGLLFRVRLCVRLSRRTENSDGKHLSCDLRHAMAEEYTAKADAIASERECRKGDSANSERREVADR